MSARTVNRIDGRLDAVIAVPGSKSIANRALICAALADGVTELSNVPDGDDTIAIFTDGTATARLPCIVATASPIESCGTLVEMARLQGALAAAADRPALVQVLARDATVNVSA